MSKLLKGILDKIFNTNQNQKLSESEVKSISQEEVEALVEARLREHAATIEQTLEDKVNSAVQSKDKEDYSLSQKQIDFAIALIEKTKEFQLDVDPAILTVKDLNKLIAFNRFKNKGILVNLVKKGILKKN
ncbi:ABC transporter ATP-binding protein [Neobacillus sp. PS2-9]|uniref:ABC transporter ATP-binding protein n=1 Tax=Neobacillus sp. PS2-9 TaxID=3070676 RepID=UPI0027E17C79|nr:ABC transporter ATP-binding protein [Neobacillus sp. PS2-9]WML56020.1 ABC transporter ATP-binding protein [Neobacillus sp. PS2-9]